MYIYIYIYSSEPTEVEVGETVSDCDGLANGNYQSAANCNTYMGCLNGDLFTSTCPENQFWDDASKSCAATTSTCDDACTATPCQNGATCTTSDGTAYTCTCAAGYTGTNCGKLLVEQVLKISYLTLLSFRSNIAL